MLAILGGVSWGISGVCSQYLFTQYDLSADWLTAIRMLLSGILLLVLAFRKEHTRIFKIWTKGKDTFWLIAFALAGLLLCQYTFLAAIKHSNSATATVLQSLNVVLMAIVMAVWNKKMMSRIQIAAIVLAFSGTYLIATKGSLTSMDLPDKPCPSSVDHHRSHRYYRHSSWIFRISRERKIYRPRKINTTWLPGTCIRNPSLSLAAGNEIYRDRTDRFCICCRHGISFRVNKGIEV